MDYVGLYEAKVVDTKDPLNRRRLKVRIHVLHKDALTGLADTALPWARPCFPYTGPQSGDDGVPEIGAEIWVAFKHGKSKFPVWLGGYYPTGEGPPELAAAQSGAIPKGYFRKTAGGWFYGVNEVTKVGKISSPTGYEMSLDETTQKATLTTKAGYKTELDEAAQKVSMETPDGSKVEIDQASQKITIETVTGNKLELDGASGESLLKGIAKAVLDAVSIELGSGATEPAVLGTALMGWLPSHTHNVTMIGAPTGPMVPPVPPIPVLSTSVLVKS